ncbi:hypothetical protein [Halomonas sp. H5]|uniref:hypothetical protein n=1 Tax=Halomonas sp. H5 TaxID=3423910 RepID=UPI003D36F390
MATLEELEEYMPTPKTLRTWRDIASRLEGAADGEAYDRYCHYGHGYAQALYDAGLINEVARNDLRGAMMTSFEKRHLLISTGV